MIERHIDFTNPTTWPQIVVLKLGLVALLLLLTFLHDLGLGPRVSQISAMPESARTSWEQVLAQSSAWVPRLALILALGVLFSAVILARS